MESVQSPYPYGLMLPQPETERLLEEKLGGLGVIVERRVELATFQRDSNGIDAILRHADGSEEAVSADWLLGCDGLTARFATRAFCRRDAEWRLDAGRCSHRNLVGHVMLGLSPARHALAANMTEVTIGYPKSPLNGPSLGGARPKPGERVVPLAGQVPVGSGGTATLCAFCGEDHGPRMIS